MSAFLGSPSKVEDTLVRFTGGATGTGLKDAAGADTLETTLSFLPKETTLSFSPKEKYWFFPWNVHLFRYSFWIKLWVGS